MLGFISRSLFHPIKSFGELKEQLGKQFSGDALWQKVTEAAKKNTNQNAVGCFVAGTLVHTRDGLRPIEQIQVGDYVLSKPEDGNGETAYKRVVNTFEFEDKEAWFVSVHNTNCGKDQSVHLSDNNKVLNNEKELTDWLQTLPLRGTSRVCAC